jgi:tetratricopeptide (TPR) repeat protein
METSGRLEKILKILVFVGLLALVFFIFSQKIELTSIDLGRHLENGRMVWQDPGVLFRNFYSYTEPDFRFINHHWLGGVIFYAVYQLGGFPLLSLFNILLALVVFSLAFSSARRRAGFYLAALLSLPIIFLLSERVEVRPEIFSYLLVLIVWRLIDKTASDKKYKRLLWFGPLFMLWANTHIYFFIGLALIFFQAVAESGVPLLAGWRDPKAGLKAGWQAAKVWIYSLVYASVFCLANPNTWRGLLYPFRIFTNYGYEIAENKSIFFLEDLIVNPNFFLMRAVLAALVLSWAIYWFSWKKLRLFDLLLSIFFMSLGFLAVRNISLSALATLIIISANLSRLAEYFQSRSTAVSSVRPWRKIYPAALAILLIISSFICLSYDARNNHYFIRHSSGWGLEDGNEDSAIFFKAHNLRGPIFNNYDLGSALIFWLYPAEKVFVDNRPEAYSASFFNDIYRPMQSDPQKWREYSRQYRIKTVYFAHTDSTPWAQDFLRNILFDQDWSLVYFDPYTVILLNREEYSAAEIGALAIDPWQFRSRLRDLAATSDLRDRFRLASLAQAAKQPDLAEEIYRKIIFDYPDNALALVSFAYLYSGSADSSHLERALDYFQSAIDSGYRLPGLYIASGLVHWRLGEYQKAEADWRSALDLGHDDESASDYLGQIENLRRAGRIPSAP